MGDEKEKNSGQVVGGDPYTMQDAGDMVASEMNERSHATQQLSEDEMAHQRTAARNLISQIFTDGNSSEMARNMVASQYPSMAGELDSLIDREKSKHGDVPETQAEADAEKAKEAQAISGALLGGATMLAGAGAIAAMFTGENAKYTQGAGALLSDPSVAEQANSVGNLLAMNVEGAQNLGEASALDMQQTMGLPVMQQPQQVGIS